MSVTKAVTHTLGPLTVRREGRERLRLPQSSVASAELPAIRRPAVPLRLVLVTSPPVPPPPSTSTAGSASSARNPALDTPAVPQPLTLHRSLPLSGSVSSWIQEAMRTKGLRVTSRCHWTSVPH